MNMFADFLGSFNNLIDVTVTFNNGKLHIKADDGKNITFVDVAKKEYGFINEYDSNSFMIHEPKISTDGNIVIVKGKYFLMPSLYYYVSSFAIDSEEDFATWYQKNHDSEEYLELYNKMKNLLDISGKQKEFTITTTKDSVKPFNTKELKQAILIVESNKKLKVMGKV